MPDLSWHYNGEKEETQMKNNKAKRIYYYVLEFLIEEQPYGNITSSMCVLGYRKPTIEEAKEFWKEDCSLYPDEKLVDIYRISSIEAHNDYDMENEKKYPIFGA